MSDNSLKILSVCYSDQAGGAAKAAYRIHKAVQAQGVQSTMLVLNKCTNDVSVIALDDLFPQNALYKASRWIRYKVQNKLQHARWNHYPNRQKQYFMSDLRHAPLSGVLQKLDFDVLHLHWPNQRFFDLAELQKIGKPIVWTQHDSWAFCGTCHYFFDCEKYKTHCANCPQLQSGKEKDLAWKIFEKKALYYKNLNLTVVTPSRWLTACAQQSALFASFRCLTIPNCLDTEIFNILPCERSEQEKRLEKPIILYGAMNAATDKRKGFANLLSALKYLKKDNLRDLELVVFGTKKPLEDLEEVFPTTYVGYITDERRMVELYNSAAVMVVPSLTEAFGFTAAEAIACGTLVVCFDCTGLKDIVIHKQNGYLAHENDNEDLAQGIAWCLEQQWNKETVRQTVVSRFAPEIVAKQYIDLYEKKIVK